MKIPKKREDFRVHADVTDVPCTFSFLCLVTLSGIDVLYCVKNTGEKWELLGTETLQNSCPFI